jgi:hypothetical protein
MDDNIVEASLIGFSLLIGELRLDFDASMLCPGYVHVMMIDDGLCQR